MFRAIFRYIGGKSNYLLGTLLLLLAVFLSLSLSSYSSSDPSFNRATNAEIQNILGYYGAYFADPLLQLIGLSNVIVIFVLFSWATQYFVYARVKLIWLRLATLVLLIFSLSGLISIFGTKNIVAFMTLGGYLGYVTKLYFLKFMPLYGFIISFLVITICLTYITLGINRARWHRVFQSIAVIAYGCYKVIKIAVYLIKFIIMKLYKSASGKKHSNIDIEKKKDLLSLKKKVPKKVVNRVHIPDGGEFRLPPLEILAEAADKSAKTNINAQFLKKSAEDLTEVLSDFGVKGEIVEVHTGPVVTLYELEPSAGTKSSRVIGLADDISRSMKAHAARIAVIPGRNAIGIELPNKKREIIYLRELLESDQYKSGEALLPMILGKDISGKPIVVDLTRMPHLLVAGTTGSGKSVSINTMILSLLYSLSPDECKLIMIDPKMLELSVYDDIPHLLTPVVTEPKKAIVALKWVVKEMEERYRMMSNLGVRSIAAYNAKIAEAKINGVELSRNVQTGFDNDTGRPIIEKVLIPMKKLPFIVVIVDEMADLMIVAGKEIETSIQRLSQMARAAGIHIIMATQRPSVDVITGVIKANFPTRISFSVTSRIDSRTILGEQGAEQLLGMGDMLYMGNGSKIIRVHGPYVADQEVRNVVDYLKSQGEPEYIDNVTVDIDEGSDSGEFAESGEDAGLYSQAVDIVARDRKASTSYIQRCLRIGYNRAASIIDRMEKEGIVSPANHVGKREVLVQQR